MSLEAMIWALDEAPDVPSQCLSVLIGLANHADSRGRGAYAGQKLMAAYARKTTRQVRTDLTRLQQEGLIRRGNQALAAHIPADCRPVVYDLAMERKQASARSSTSARNSASPSTGDWLGDRRASDQQEHEGSGSEVPPGSQVPGGSEDPRERKPASYKPTTNRKNSSSKSSKTSATGSLFGDDDGQAEGKPKRWTEVTIKPLFAEWYAVYPLHKERSDAEKAYLKAVNAGADPAILIAAAKSYCTDLKVLAGYIKHPATWLNKGCWTDEPTPEPPAAASQNGHVGKQTNYDDEEYHGDW